MALNLPQVPFKLTAEDMGNFDLNKAISSGLRNYNTFQEARFKPKTLAENLLGQQLENKINTSKAKYADQLAQAELSHRNALIQKALQGPQAPAEIQTLEWLLKNKDRFNQGANQPANEQMPSVGEGQPSYINSLTGNQPQEPQEDYGQKLFQHVYNKAAGIKDDAKYAPSNTAKELREQTDAEDGYIPNTDRKERFKTEQSRRNYLDSLGAKTGGLKRGSHFIFGENGERIGESRPKTQKERDTDKAAILFNEFFPKVNSALNEYSGEKSIRKLENDARNYKTDPSARKRFDAMLLAMKLRNVTGVTEAARFGAGRTNQTFKRFFETLSSYDIPQTVDKLVKEYQIPSSANIKAGSDFLSSINKADQVYAKKASPNMNEYYPGKEPKSNQESEQDFENETGHSDQDIQDTAAHFNTSPSIVLGAIRAGVKTEEEFKDYIREVSK